MNTHKKSDLSEGKISMVIDRIEGEKAVLISGKEEMMLSKKLLPENVKEGDSLAIYIKTDAEDHEKRQKEAKELLNQILRG